MAQRCLESKVIGPKREIADPDSRFRSERFSNLDHSR
jgi:hypothetical protein